MNESRYLSLFVVLICLGVFLPGRAMGQVAIEDPGATWERPLVYHFFSDIEDRIVSEYASVVMRQTLVLPDSLMDEIRSLPPRVVIEYSSCIHSCTLQSFPFCEGDFDADADVDGTDLSVFAADFGRTDCKGDCEGDFDHDQDVDGSDLATFATDFGRTDCLLKTF